LWKRGCEEKKSDLRERKRERRREKGREKDEGKSRKGGMQERREKGRERQTVGESEGRRVKEVRAGGIENDA
jgi:hypothetical protein